MKKHKLLYNFTNVTIKMVKFYPNSISCIINRSFQLYIVGYRPTMSVLVGSVLGTFPNWCNFTESIQSINLGG